jgi:hypothetical protein
VLFWSTQFHNGLAILFGPIRFFPRHISAIKPSMPIRGAFPQLTKLQCREMRYKLPRQGFQISLHSSVAKVVDKQPEMVRHVKGQGDGKLPAQHARHVLGDLVDPDEGDAVRVHQAPVDHGECGDGENGSEKYVEKTSLVTA